MATSGGDLRQVARDGEGHQGSRPMYGERALLAVRTAPYRGDAYCRGVDIEGGGAYLNNIREANFQRAVTTNDLLFGKHLLLRKGKRNYVLMTTK